MSPVTLSSALVSVSTATTPSRRASATIARSRSRLVTVSKVAGSIGGTTAAREPRARERGRAVVLGLRRHGGRRGRDVARRGRQRANGLAVVSKAGTFAPPRA